MGVYLGQSIYNDSQVTPEWVEEEIAKNGKGVFFATYGQTTYQNILQEYNNGKIIVCKYEPETPGETTTYYFNLVRFNTETFDFVGVMQDGTIYRTGINVNDGWENVTTFKLDEIEFVEYNVDSYSTIKSYYDYGKFVVLKYMQQTPLATKYYFYPLVSVDETNKEIVFGSLELGQNNKKITFTVTDSTGWSLPVQSSAVVVDVALDSSSHNPVENMAIAAELTEINNKITGDLNDIFLALASKGVTVPAGAGLDDVAGLINDIEQGGEPETPTGYVLRTALWASYGDDFNYNYINTNENTTITLVFQAKVASNTISSVLAGLGGNSVFNFSFNSSSTGKATVTNQNNTSTTLNIFSLDNLRKLKATLKNNEFSVTDDISVFNSNNIPYSPATLSRFWISGSSFYIYKLILENGSKKSILQPAQRLSDNAWGFYDMIQNVFYTKPSFIGI